MARQDYTFTSESVSEGHPDKVCDRISDAVLDAFLNEEPEARVACETFATTNRVVIGGEVGLSDQDKLHDYMGRIDQIARDWTDTLCRFQCPLPVLLAHRFHRARKRLGLTHGLSLRGGSEPYEKNHFSEGSDHRNQSVYRCPSANTIKAPRLPLGNSPDRI